MKYTQSERVMALSRRGFEYLSTSGIQALCSKSANGIQRIGLRQKPESRNWDFLRFHLLSRKNLSIENVDFGIIKKTSHNPFAQIPKALDILDSESELVFNRPSIDNNEKNFRFCQFHSDRFAVIFSFLLTKGCQFIIPREDKCKRSSAINPITGDINMKGKIRFLGHSFAEFTTGSGEVVLFDPWAKDDGNPGCPVNKDEITKADLVLVSHDHADHAASARAICETTGAKLGGPVQTIARFTDEGMKTEDTVNYGMGYMVGGGVALDWVKTTAVPAFHSSDTACALGTIVQAADGTTVYHAGDTCLYGDMEMWGRLYPIDVALLPIGGIFTMDAFQAAEAVALIKPQKVIPIHYASFPIIAPNADEFKELCAQKAPGVEVIALKAGESVDLA